MRTWSLITQVVAYDPSSSRVNEFWKAEWYVGERQAKGPDGSVESHSEKRGCWLSGRSWQGKWETRGTWGQLSQEDTCSAALFGAGWRSPRLSMDSPRPCHTSCGFSRVPVSVLYVTPEDRLLFPRVQWVSVCSVKASLVPSLHQSFLQACVCSVFIQCSNPQMIAQSSHRQSPGTSTSLDWLQGIGMCLLDLKASYKLFSVVSLESPCTGGRGRSQLATWPFTQQVRKSQQKGHLSLLLGNKSTFVLLAQLKECHYYQINCVVTNQSSQLSFKCELWWLSGLHTCFHSQDTTEFKLHI